MRPDGKRVKNEDPMYYLIPYFLRKRYDAMNMITLDIPETPMRTYMNAKRREGKSISHLALILTAYLHTVKKYPALNRFVVGRKIYEHNDITVSMVALKPGTDLDTMSKIALDPEDDVFDVQEKITSYIDQNRQLGEANGLDQIMNILVRMNFLLSIFIGLVRFLDRIGLLPKFLINVSPFHASLLISNLASIRSNAIFHHVYDFGSTSIALTMGTQKEEPKRGPGGAVGFERCIPMGVVMDERICNGLYFSQAFSRFRSYLADPVKLEGKPAFEVLTMKQASELP